MDQRGLAVLDLVRADLDPEGDPVEFPLVELEAGVALVAVVEFDPQTGLVEFGREVGGVVEHFFLSVLLPDRHHDDLFGGERRWEHEPLVVGVGHHHPAERAPRQPPRGGVGDVFVLVAVDVGHVERLREPVAEVVAGGGLERPAVGHEGLDGRRGVCAGKLVVFGFAALQHGHREHLLVELAVLFESAHRFLPRRLAVLVGGVTLLPEELLRAEERLRVGGLPAHHRTPLVHPHREVAVAPDPLAHEGRDDRLAGGTHGEPFVELLVARLGDPRHLGVEALHDVLLAFEVALGDEHREVGVLDARLLEPAVEMVLDALPEGVAAGSGDDEPAHRGVVRELRFLDDLGEPLAGRVLLRFRDTEFL